MQLIPWRHAIARNGYANEMDRLIEHFFGEPLGSTLQSSETSISMPVDVTETGDSYRIKVELPGVDPKDVEVTLDEGVLTIKGEKRSQAQSDKEGRHISERRYGTFQRSFALPNAVDQENVKARHEVGVLTVELQKVAPNKPRKIEIESK